jgi:hypothetical protein
MAPSFESGIAAVLFCSELLSSALAFCIAYLMLRSYRVVRREYLLGFPIGFTFLGLSYLLLGVAYASPSYAEITSWLHLLVGTYGFAFLAGTYFLRQIRRSVARWVFSLLVVLAVVLVLVVVVPPSLLIPPYALADEAFRIVNLGLLAYVILSLSRLVKAEPYEVSTLVLAGFVCLAIGQYSLLLWALDEGFWAFVSAHLWRLAGLLALAASAVSSKRHA